LITRRNNPTKPAVLRGPRKNTCPQGKLHFVGIDETSLRYATSLGRKMPKLHQHKKDEESLVLSCFLSEVFAQKAKVKFAPERE